MYRQNLGVCQPLGVTSRGRPPLVSDDEILSAALAAFATSGYEAMSVRALNAELGLSHETISKRFGPKLDLFRAAVKFGASRLAADFDAEMQAAPSDDLGRLRVVVRAFMVSMSRNPVLGELVHPEGLNESERAALLADSGLNERMAEVVALLSRLHAAGEIYETQLRDLWFLAQGAIAPMHFQGLSQIFDAVDGPVDPEELINRMTAAIMRSMGVQE